jgi:hypothetical protein
MQSLKRVSVSDRYISRPSLADQWTEPCSLLQNPSEPNKFNYSRAHPQLLLDRMDVPNPTWGLA